jgi:hypothetical protein
VGSLFHSGIVLQKKEYLYESFLQESGGMSEVIGLVSGP